MGVLKVKFIIKLFKSYPKIKEESYWGNHFWARGYFVSTNGLDEYMIKKYVYIKRMWKRKLKTNNKSLIFNTDTCSPYLWLAKVTFLAGVIFII